MENCSKGFSQGILSGKDYFIFAVDLVKLVPIMVVAVPIVLMNVARDRLSKDKSKKSRICGIDW
ncbi:MAG: hypothetical protein WC663_05275 [Patescibacteria group bacterium]|jgi:hypothetical protein